MIQIVCTNCKKPFNLNPVEVASATVEGALTHTYTFVCDNCHTPNKLNKEQFEAAKNAHETGASPAMAPAAKPAMAPAAAMPARPMVAAHEMQKDDMAQGSSMGQAGMSAKGGTVLVASLHVRKDHSTTSETVRGLVKGDKVTISTVWGDGKNSWAQIGPNEWAAIEYDGKKMIDVK